jgi:hypothetical protein
MIAVTVIACGCNDQALFEKAFPMNTLGVIGQDIVFGNVVYTGNRSALPVTFSAQHRDVHLISTGFRIYRREDIMITVTLPAGWGVRGIPF